MPLHNRIITPTRVSRSALPGEDNSEFEGVSNRTLASLMLQMASLLRNAENMFGELEVEMRSVEMTSRRIKERVIILQSTVNSLDCLEEKVGDMESCRKIDNHLVQTYLEENNLFLPESRPQSIKNMLNNLQNQRVENPRSQDPPYLCIPIKKDLNSKYFNVETETKRVSVELNIACYSQIYFKHSDSQRIQPSDPRQTAQTEYDKIPVTNICKIFCNAQKYLFMENIFRLRRLTLTASPKPRPRPHLPQMRSLSW